MTAGQRRWIWVVSIVLCVGSIVVFGVRLRHSRERTQGISARPEVAVSMDSQGRATVGGVTIGNTNVRDAVFSAMGNLNVKAQIVVPNMMTNGHQASNFIEQINRMNRAGVQWQGEKGDE